MSENATFQLWGEKNFGGAHCWAMIVEGTFDECYRMRHGRGVGDSWHIDRIGSPSITVVRSVWGSVIAPLDIKPFSVGDKVFWYGAGAIRREGAILALEENGDRVAVDDQPDSGTYAVVRRQQLQHASE